MLRSGDLIGPYTLINKIGRGAFGTVWLSERRTMITTTTAALKIPLDDDVDLETIKHEANLWVRASGHPNVLPIIEANIYDDQVVIASEYAPDGSLEAWLKQNGGKAPSVEAAVEIIFGVLAGLEHLHGRNIIHRDLKPANILFQGSTPRLADFGISRVLKSTSQSSIVAGTPSYMAPEAFDGKRNEQTDVWSVGVIFYQLLAGRLPFPQADITSLVGAILSRNPDPLPLSVPSPLQEIIACALNKDPNQRYKSVAEMRADLRNPKPKDSSRKSQYATEPVTTIPASPAKAFSPEPSPLYPTKKVSSPHVVYAIAGLLAVLIVVAGIVWLKSGETNANSNNLSVVSQENAKTGTRTSSTSLNNTSATSFNFAINNTPEHFESTLNLLGAYEIAIPNDNQWHDTKIQIYPNNQLQIGFMRGTEGNVAIQIGEVSSAFSQAQPEDTYYEYDLRTRAPRNQFEHTLRNPSTLKVRSSQNNVFIRVEVRQL
jgi:serine/threonine protein kinase